MIKEILEDIFGNQRLVKFNSKEELLWHQE